MKMTPDDIEEKVNKSFLPDKDLYRDTPVRYLGYSNEVGEAFRPLIKKIFVHLSYGIAVTYVCADAFDKSHKVYKRPSGGGAKAAAITAGDVLLWQMLASVIIPGFTINRICWGTGKLLKMTHQKGVIKKWVPTFVGLASIPAIIHPIDNFVDTLMDKTYRVYIK
ncbi:mitochondrial fission process protein 1 [Lutzomyia longipalpis]|uniref:Mitochondrial fission process protein 1 n=2 Tax=Lutzomyia longipalpis TaxID=7200 RepID=A0A1B0GH43_LUTLO|nr:mitochondrial fission process protein 1 [Lutzomyia longipalpis]